MYAFCNNCAILVVPAEMDKDKSHPRALFCMVFPFGPFSRSREGFPAYFARSKRLQDGKSSRPAVCGAFKGARKAKRKDHGTFLSHFVRVLVCGGRACY